MPRKAQPTQTTQTLSELVAAVEQPAPYASFEDLPDFVPAIPPDEPAVHPAGEHEQEKRAIPIERTSFTERAEVQERTKTIERESASPAEARESASPANLESEEARTSNFTFKSRVMITDGFQYHGTYSGVPAWASRDWLQYDSSPPKGYKPGPALYLPDGQICRMTDWIVHEEVEGRIRMVVYSDENMQHFFSVVPA